MAVKYKILAERLEEMTEDYIRKGRPMLPTEKELEERYHVSRQTVRAALGLLEKKGLIERRQGSGSHITGRLSGHDKNQTAVLLPDEHDYIYPELIDDIHNVLSAAGFSCTVFSTENSFSKEREILLKLLKSPPRGILVEGCKSALPNPNLSLYHRLMKKGCQIVFLLSRYPSLLDCPCIKDDNLTGSAMLVRHLAELGHTAIGGIFRFDDLSGTERFQGFCEALTEFGLSFLDSRVSWYGTRELNLLRAGKSSGFLRSVIETSLSDCTAVVCQDDRISYFLVEELKAAGYTLPEDMAVAAFGNSYLSDSPILPVTALSRPPHGTGERAALALVEKLKGLPAVSQETPWTLHIKESTVRVRGT